MIQLTKLEAGYVLDTLQEVRDFLEEGEEEMGLLDHVIASEEIINSCLVKPEVDFYDGTTCVEDEFSLL